MFVGQKAHARMPKSGKFWFFATITAFTAAATAQTNQSNWLPMGQATTAAASESTIRQQGQTVTLPTNRSTEGDSQPQTDTAQATTTAVAASDSSKQSSAQSQSSLSSNNQAAVAAQTSAADNSQTSADQTQSGKRTQTAATMPVPSSVDNRQQVDQKASTQSAASTSGKSSDQLANRLGNDSSNRNNGSAANISTGSEDEGTTSTVAKGKALVPDDTLRNALAQATHVSADDLTADQLAKLTSLKITSGKITSLQGLDYAKNLESLTMIGSGKQAIDETNDIQYCQYDDSVYMYSFDQGNADISAVLNDDQWQSLNQLTKLSFVQFTGLGIRDPKVIINQIKNKQNLKIAYFDKNEMDNMTAFQGLHMDQLKILSLAGNNITDISGMQHLDLSELQGLDLSYNKITDISPIAESKIANIQSLLFNHNQLQSIAIMKGLNSHYPNLHTIQFDYNKLSSISAMNGYVLNVGSRAQNQNYSQQLTLVKPNDNQDVEIPMPIQTTDFREAGDLYTYRGYSDQDGHSLTLGNLPVGVTAVRLYDGSVISVNDAKNNNFAGVKSFFMPIVANQPLPKKVSFTWIGGLFFYTGTANLTLNWVDPVAPVLNASDQKTTVGDQFNPLAGVTAYDQQQDGSAQVNLTNDIQVVDNQVNNEQPGQYAVHYQVKNSRGLTTDKTITVTVVARHASGPVGPDNPDLPDSVKKKLTKEVTRTVRFVDDKGNMLASSQRETVQFQRTASYQENQGQYVPNNDWRVVDEPSTFAAVDVNKVVDSSKYINPKISMNGKDVSSITAEIPTAESVDENVVVTYQDKVTPVGPKTPNVPKTVTDHLSKDVTRTVNFVDDKGSLLAVAEKTTVHLERTADYNFATGEVGYHNDWHVVGEPSTFAAVDVDKVVDSSKYTNPKISMNGKDVSSITAEIPTAESVDENVVVTYQDKVTPVGPKTPNVPKAVTDHLSKDVTRTVNFVDDKGNPLAAAEKTTVHLERTADYKYATGEVNYHNDWHVVEEPSTFAAIDVNQSVASNKYKDPKITINGKDASAITAEVPTADSNDENIVVTYQRQADKSKKVTPDNPGAVDVNTLQKTVTRTIQYKNQEGQALALPAIETVHFTRAATVDEATNQVLSYTNWQASENPVWEAKISLDFSEKGYDAPSEKLVPSENVTADTQDTSLVVIYKTKHNQPMPNNGDNSTPSNGGGTKPANSGNNTPSNGGTKPANSGNNTPSNGSGNQPANGDNAPSNGGGNQPANGGNNKPSNGGGNQPANGGNNTPNNGGGNQPANAGNNTPSNGGGNQPANSGNNTPINGGGTKPANGGNNTPSNGGGTKPANAGNNTPSNGGGTKPANGGNNTPSNGGGTKPANSGNNTPSNGGGNQPANGGNSMPSNGSDNQPAKGGNNTPSNGGGTKPANAGNNTPSNGGGNQPANSGNNTPSNGPKTKPFKAGDVSPNNSDDHHPSQPVQQPLAKHAQAQRSAKQAMPHQTQAATAVDSSVNKMPAQQVSALPATAKQTDNRVAKFATVGLLTTMSASLALWFGQSKKR
ncbi:leucine-rich repeat domain-containing protein [Leuconostocaceae bacterium ESL0958]|nr:leucine-rich repeat domain-containing protein [Leuconostocaceae bacterium ESL0958]